MPKIDKIKISGSKKRFANRDKEISGIPGLTENITLDIIYNALHETERQKDILEVIGKVSALLLEPDINTFKHAIFEAMEIIARGINAHRIDIWRQRGSGGEKNYTLEYAWPSGRAERAGGKDDESAIVLFIREEESVTALEKYLLKGEAVNRKVKHISQQGQQLIRDNGIIDAKSALIMPIVLNDEYWGFISAFDMETERTFTDNEVMLLRSSQRMIAGAMMRMEITKDLMHQTDRLRYELDSRRDFMARMSHEIRTPLNAILGMTELALRERMSNTANEYIMTVKQTGMNLLSIVNDILDYSKIESGNLDITDSSYMLSSLIYDIISIIRMRLAYTRIRFIVDIDSHLPGNLIGDEGKLRQILINLLSNAVKYTQKGFVKLTVTGEVRGDGKLELIMIVTDSGKGIKEEDQAKLFRDYIQVDKEKNAGIEGVGLGLSICHGLATAMNGTISLKSVYGEGSEFTVRIPQRIDDCRRLAEVSQPESKTTLVYERRSMYVDTLVQTIKNLGVRCDVVDNPEEALSKMATGSYAFIIGSNELLVEIGHKLEDLKGDFQIIGISEFRDESDSIWRTLSTPVHTISLANVLNGEADRYIYSDDEDNTIRFSAPEARVLVVDDITTNLKVAAGLLTIFDVDIDVCSGGAEAIELVRENRYDIIFMDHRMPVMDGVEATRRIRALESNDGYFRNVPIVVLTANVMSNMKDMFMESGFNDFIAKPIDTVILSDIMRKWIPKSKQRRYYAVEDEYTAAMAAEAGPALRIQGVNVEKGFRTSGGRMDYYLEILATLADEASGQIAGLAEYASTGNIRLYTATVHALKGALANIGADELAALALKLETAGERKDASFIEKNNERFISGMNRLIANINAVLEDTAKNAGGGKKTGKKETALFIASLEELKGAIADMNAGRMNKTLETLLGDAITEQSLSTVRLISKHILMAEYDDAEKLTGELIRTLTEDSKRTNK